MWQSGNRRSATTIASFTKKGNARIRGFLAIFWSKLQRTPDYREGHRNRMQKIGYIVTVNKRS